MSIFPVESTVPTGISCPKTILPFALGGAGLVTLALAYFLSGARTINLLRWSMIVIGLCSLIGIYEHTANNLGFQMEIQPKAAFQELILAMVEGANPVLAPGILALGAAIGWTATYQHPALERTARAVVKAMKQKA